MFSVEESIQSFLSFVKKFVTTTYRILFTPFRIYHSVKSGVVDNNLLSPFLYLFLCIIIYMVAYKSRSSDLIQLPFYANFQKSISEYSFVENVFIILPILLVFYAIIRVYIWIFRLNKMQGRTVLMLSVYWFGIGVILEVVRMSIFYLMYEWGSHLGYDLHYYIERSPGFLSGLFDSLLFLIPAFILVKEWKMTRKFPYGLILFPILSFWGVYFMIGVYKIEMKLINGNRLPQGRSLSVITYEDSISTKLSTVRLKKDCSIDNVRSRYNGYYALYNGFNDNVTITGVQYLFHEDSSSISKGYGDKYNYFDIVPTYVNDSAKFTGFYSIGTNEVVKIFFTCELVEEFVNSEMILDVRYFHEGTTTEARIKVDVSDENWGVNF